MAYLGTHSTTPIIPEFPCTGYGDLLLVEPHGKSEKISEPVTQHNLAAFWNRLGLIPTAAGFPVPLVHTANFGAKGVYSRHPGAWLFSTPKVRSFRRNLLCSELRDHTSEASGVRLFVVNELSDRKTLIETEFSFKNPFCSRNRFFKLSASDFSKTIELPAEALELRAFEHDHFERNLFIRTKDSLNLCDTNAATINKCFDFPVSDFFQVPYLNEDLVIVDSFQQLWHGTLGSNFSRKKINMLIQAAAPTDCPKVVLVSDGEEIRLVDLRENRASNDTFFKVEDPSFFISADTEMMQAVADLHRSWKEEIFHLSTLPDRPFASMASSGRHHFLLDHRVPGQAIITMSHSIINGGDYCFAAPPMKDSFRDGYIYSYFSLNQTAEPQTSYWPVYINTRNSVWSSLGPIQSLPMPQTIEKYYSTQPGMYPVNFSSRELPSRTRSLCYQPLTTTHSMGDTRALIFRQMDSGDIWYDNLIIDPTSNPRIDQQKYRAKTCRMIEKFFAEADDARHFGLRLTALNADDAIVQDPQSKMRCFKIAPDLSEIPSLEGLNISEAPQDSDPFAEIGVIQSPLFDATAADELEIQDTANEENIYSTIILKQWAKSDLAFLNYLNGAIASPNEAADDPMSEVLLQPGPSSGKQSPARNKVVTFADEIEEEEFNFDEMDFNLD